MRSLLVCAFVMILMTTFHTSAQQQLVVSDSAHRTCANYFTQDFRGHLFAWVETTEALNFLWHHSFHEKISRKGKRTLLPVREVAAWITPEGILVQPWAGPLFDEAGNVMTPWAVNYCTSFAGVSYHNFLPLRTGTCAVFFEGRWLEILGEIHTHPVTGGMLREEDQQAEREFGIPVYCMERGVIKDAHGHRVATLYDPAGFLRLFFRQDQLWAHKPSGK